VVVENERFKDLHSETLLVLWVRSLCLWTETPVCTGLFIPRINGFLCYKKLIKIVALFEKYISRHDTDAEIQLAKSFVVKH